MKPTRVRPLAEVLQGQEIGAWVVLSPDMNEVLGAGSRPEDALQQAKIVTPCAAQKKRPVLMQVLDPRLAWL